MKEKYRKIISNFKGKKIAVLGDSMLDEFIFGRVERISPEAPVPVVTVERKEYRPGGAANVWRNLRDLGARAFLFSVVGDDREGEILKEMLSDALFIVEKERPTTLKTRIIAQHQQVVRVDRESTREIKNETAEKLIAELLSTQVEGVIISDYEKGVISAHLLKNLLPALKDRIPVFVDPKLKNFRLYRPVFMIKPNQKEVSALAGRRINSIEDLKKVGKEIKKELQPRVLCITMGEKGMLLFTDEQVKHIPSRALEVFDVTGAGDTVISVFALSYLAGASVEEAAELANYAASVVIRKIGTSSLFPEELISSVEEM